MTNQFWLNKKREPMQGDKPYESCPVRRAELEKEHRAWKDMPLLGKIVAIILGLAVALLPEIIGYYFFW